MTAARLLRDQRVLLGTKRPSIDWLNGRPRSGGCCGTEVRSAVALRQFRGFGSKLIEHAVQRQHVVEGHWP